MSKPKAIRILKEWGDPSVFLANRTRAVNWVTYWMHSILNANGIQHP